MFIYRNYFLILVISLAFLTVSCEFFFMKPVEVIRYAPDDPDNINLSVLSLLIEFSSEMNQAITEKAFSFTEDDRQVNGAFSWNSEGTILTFTPTENLSGFHNYKAQLTTTAEDQHGNSLIETWIFRFTTKPEDDSPHIASISPSNNEIIDDSQAPITISFSKQVNRASFYEAFTLSPSVEGYWTWSSDDMTATFHHNIDFLFGKDYAITIDESLCDTYGNNLEKTRNYSFHVGSDTIPPTITTLTYNGTPLDHKTSTLNQNTDLITNGTFEITFSEPITTDDIKSHIFFSNSIDFTIDDSSMDSDNMLIISLNQPFAYNETAFIRLTQDISDLQDNPLNQVYEYHCQFNNDQTRPPVLTRIAYFKPISTTFQSLDNFGEIDLSSFVGPNSEEFFIDLYFQISDSAADGIVLNTVIDSFQLSYSNNGVSDYAVNEITGTANPTSLSYPGLGLEGDENFLVRLHMSLEIMNDSFMIYMDFDNSIQDTLGNTMLDPISFTFTYNNA